VVPTDQLAKAKIADPHIPENALANLGVCEHRSLEFLRSSLGPGGRLRIVHEIPDNDYFIRLPMRHKPIERSHL
jgi:hypothetical protein